MKRIAVLASGRGSNFQAVIDALRRGKVDAVCERLITDNPLAYALQRAARAHIPATVIPFEAFPSREQYEGALLRVMQEIDPDLFVLAGYMRILGQPIVRAFPGRIINIHPALLPSFPGLHAPRQTLAYGAKVSGCTVHFVDEGMDSGPILIQRCVPVRDDDDEESLARRILRREHRALVDAVRLVCEERVRIEGRMVRILPQGA
jgi:phosphoribosylglycinamide formyltransferase-1